MIILSKYLIKETTFIIDNFWLYEEYCFLNLPPIFLCPLSDFGKRYKNKLNVSFDQWPKLYLGLNGQPKIQILNGF